MCDNSMQPITMSMFLLSNQQTLMLMALPSSNEIELCLRKIHKKDKHGRLTISVSIGRLNGLWWV
uniref:Uncharacterized protein n=1 Tax=Xenopus tropicalis TaxID=8364 RepID=A0A1B8YAB2_XENTR